MEIKGNENNYSKCEFNDSKPFYATIPLEHYTQLRQRVVTLEYKLRAYVRFYENVTQKAELLELKLADYDKAQGSPSILQKSGRATQYTDSDIPEP